ncbi:MAG: hypothetical protein ABIG55_05850 [Candidatus Omnitrophota bacterium]|nr:hypothetical protein [Candidatus Omnitrophota bacterium]
MITKTRLLSGLNEIVYVEEGMIGMFVGFSKAMVREDNSLDDAKRKEIEKLLSRLLNDSARHKKMIEELILIVEKGDQNEY